MRVAAADIGTNSTRLLVADVGGDGTVAEVERLLEITRLGEGVDASGALGEVPMGRVTTALAHFAERARARSATHMLAVATSAVRDRLDGFDLAKGTIRFTPERQVPRDVIVDLVYARLQELGA